MKIAFFIGSVDISGGTYVIFQHALYCTQQGHTITIVAQSAFTADQLTWHSASHILKIVHVDDLQSNEHFDLAIATWWKTATELHRLSATQYAYFVQSIESRFYPETEIPLRALVESTYMLPLPGITEATWIQRYLSERHRHDYFLVRNGIRKDLYNMDSPARSAPLNGGKLRVLVEGPLGVDFKNVGRTLKLARKSNAAEIWLLTSSDISWLPGVEKVFSRVPITEVPAIYRSCDVILKLSYVEGMFGPPLEMFHCGGTAIIYDVSGHDEYIIDNHNALVIDRDDEKGVIEAINKLAAQKNFLDSLKKNALITANTWPDWSDSSRQFLAALHSIMATPFVDREQIRVRNENAMKTYSINEACRLKKHPGIKVGYRLDAMVNKLPKRLVRILRQVHYVIESIR